MANDPNGDSVNSVTTAQLTALTNNGIWGVGPTVDDAAANVGAALVATLRGTASGVLTSDLSEMTNNVLGVATVDFPRIEADDGVQLAAHTIKLNTGGPRPVVIVPAGWTPVGWPLFEYAHIMLALRGYHVLAYTPRGIGTTVANADGGYVDGPFTSGGTIDVGGPRDWADGSTVIDYAQEYFDPSAIGFLGESYGSGISQLVAANDPEARVSAVVALSTWGNLATSLYDHDTRHLQAVAALLSLTGGPVERKFDEATQQILRNFQDGTDLDQVVAWGTERAPQSYAEQTNARGIPTFFSNTWHEALFPVNQVIDVFTRLEVPKHLNLWIGDHAVPEGPGLIGSIGRNAAMAEAYAWLDHHLLGAANDVPSWPQVNNQIMFTYQTRPKPNGQNQVVTPARREPNASWEDVTTTVERWYLADDPSSGDDGALATNPGSGWSRGFTAGELTEARAMDAIMDTGKAEWNGNPKTYRTEDFDRGRLAVWLSEPLTARRIRGIPTVRLTMSGTDTSATLVAYLFDVADDDTARLVTHEPYTLVTLTPGEDVTVEWRLQAAGYDLPADHRLALVVNSKDPLYSDANVPGSTITIGSVADNESYVDLPLG
jgi:predicted acyl esterase